MERLLRVILKRQTFALEAFLAAQCISWGMWILDPTHSAFSYWSEPTILSMLPEPIVGATVTVHGIAYGYAISKKNTKWCRRGALATAGIWTVVLASVIMAAPFYISTPIYFSNVAASLWVYLRLHLRYS